MTNKIFTRQSFLKFYNWLLEGITTLCTPGRYHSWKDLWIINTIYLHRYLFKIKNKLDTFINLRESINHSSTNQRWKFIWYIDFLSLVRFDSPPFLPDIDLEGKLDHRGNNAYLSSSPGNRILRTRQETIYVSHGTTCCSLSPPPSLLLSLSRK